MRYKIFLSEARSWLPAVYPRRCCTAVNWHPVQLFVLFFIMTLALPAWSAGLKLPSVHQLKPVRRNHQPVLPGPKPVVTGASYHLAARCTNPLHAITVTVHIRNEGGPLKAAMAKIVISEPHRHLSPIWNANDGSGLIPALAPGQVYTTKLFVGTLKQYRKALPGSHTLFVEVSPNESDTSQVSHKIPNSMYQFRINIPAGYCQKRLTPVNKKSLQLRQRKPVYPPSPCLNGNCRSKSPVTLDQRSSSQRQARLRPCLGSNCLAAKQTRSLNKRAIAKFGAALKPDLQVVSVKVKPEKLTSGTPLVVYAVVQNKGATASKAGAVLHIFCNAYGNANTPPTGWTCKVPAQGVSPGGMPMWNIPLPAVPGHGQSDVALRIPEHWPEGMYYFTHSGPGQAVTISFLKNAKTDEIVEVDK